MAGTFAPSTQFEARCEVPRIGNDIEGNAFPDLAGSTLEENFWLRSWTNETYLFNTEVTDRDPADFSDRVDYFDILRTMAVTPSGEDKDDFHFSEPTEDFLVRRNAAPQAGYGARFIAFSTSVPRDFRVLFTDTGTPATEIIGGIPNFVRGASILEVDGIDLVNGGQTQTDLDALNEGLFPSVAGVSHTFVVQDPGAASSRTISVTSANLSPQPVNRTRIINTPSGDVGYILFNTFSPFSSERAIAEAFAAMRSSGVSDLVLDLRYNGGGLLAIASQLSFMIAGESATRNRSFEELRFNASSNGVNPVTGESNNAVPFYNEGLGFSLARGTPLESLNLRRVFILSTEGTCSASEAVINGLRGINVEVILIGDTTCGKPFGFYPTDNCGRTYYTIQFQGINDIGFGDYTDGFIPNNSTALFGVRTPGCTVNDDFNNDLGDENEGLLSAALQFRATGTCPTVPTSKTSPVVAFKSKQNSTIATTSLTLIEDLVRNSRDLTLPQQ